MKNTFLIIDDDINIRKMLGHLIIKNNLGRVVEELEDGGNAVEEILFYEPDIVLIDFLLPEKDGIEIIRSSKSQGYKGKFIMISQVDNEDMIGEAYENGIIFFINKPINKIEAINVIKGVCNNIKLERSVSLIRDTVFDMEEVHRSSSSDDWRQEVQDICTDIGIIGESGYKDLSKLIEEIIFLKRKKNTVNYQLQDIYHQMAEKEKLHYNTHVHARTIEQRIRRVTFKALENIAALGKDDHYNSQFAEYSGVLFDFKQVKQQIQHIKNPKSERGKINVKKFVEGILLKLNF
ncbi:MAG: response regulator [Clostridiaceae bacterium]|nr:response regulator [Clostridiaceae bacterium]